MSHQITFQPSGHRISVESGESVLEAALRQGLVIPYSCRGGTCGSCSARLIEGRVNYPGGLPPALSEAEAAAGTALLCQARAETDLTVEVREIRRGSDIAPRKLPARVERIEQVAHDVRRLWLRTPGNSRLQFLAGQYVDVLLAGGRHRSFSLANPPHDDELLELHVRQVEGGEFSRFVFEDLKVGALLRLEGPFGQFTLREDSPRPVLLVAGGTGFAPIKGLLEHAFHLGETRPLHLYWGARARRDLYLDELPRRWAAERPHFRYTPVLSEPAEEDRWQGHTGLVHRALLEDYPDLSGHDVYMAGPPPMIEAARRDFAAAGLDPARLYFDSFEFAPDSRA